MTNMPQEQIDIIVKEIISNIISYKDGDDVSTIINDFQSEKSKNFDIKNKFTTELKNLIAKNKSSKIKKGIIPKIKEFIGDKNFESIIDALRDANNNFFEDLYVVKYDEKKRDKGGKKNKIKYNAKFTYLISGTNDICRGYVSGTDIGLRTLSENYFLPDNNLNYLSSRDAALVFAKYFNPGSGTVNYKFFEWYGENDTVSRDLKAKEIADDIRDELIKDKNASFNLMGHSHGGNIMIKAVNILSSSYNLLNRDNINDVIFNLITLSTPVRPPYETGYHINDKIIKHINHINLYCANDFVQTIGWIDFDEISPVIILILLSGFFSLIYDLCGIWDHHKFKYAKNTTFKWSDSKNTNDILYDKIRKLVEADKGTPFVRRHQITRSVDFVKKYLK